MKKVKGGDKMGNVVWTPAQRDAIFSRGKSVVVSAAAGSGKTAVLTRRIIERVCAPDGSGDLSRILVVTFTKAAASELVSRISDALADELAKHPENRHIYSQSLLVSSAHISTIHSFCLELIRTNFQKLGVPADFSAADETEITLMMKRLADELISDYFEGEISPDEEKIEDFARFADTFGDISNMEKLSETMLSLYRSLSSTAGFLDNIDRFRLAYEKAAADGFDGSVWEQSLRAYLADFLRHYKTIYVQALAYIAANDLYAKYTDAFSHDLSYVEKLLYLAENGSSYQALSEALASYSPVKLAAVRGVSGDETMNTYKGARTEFAKELRRISAEYYSFSDEALRTALAETAELLRDLAAFLCTFDKRFSEEKRRRRIITFADMERYALALLWDKTVGAPTELARSLQNSFDEIYIDEYQDTNEIQDMIFRLISRGNNRFCVGDVKQSIYSFRGAEPSIFEAELSARPKYDKACPQEAVKIYLSENFRSSAEILDFCNGIFEKLMNADAVRYGEDERLNCGTGRHGAFPEICLLAKPEEDEEDESSDAEADYVAGRISELLGSGKKADGSPVRPSDIVILLRSAASSSSVYEDALKKRGIPCRNTAAIEFFESPEVLLMLSLLNVIDNPARDIYLAAALKSPLYGVTLDELMFLRRHSPEGTLFQALCRFTEETGFAKGEKFLRDREAYARLSAELPCDKLIWQIYTDTGIFSILTSDREKPVYETEQARANLVMLYQYARGFERGGFKGLSGFISFINDVIANKEKLDISQFASPGEVVNIMTIHKSKGLEFPICFVCGMSRRFHFPEQRNKTVYHARLGISVKLSAESGLVRMDTPMRMASLLDLRLRAVDEELRVLYVALTRAKERLIITAAVKAEDIDSGKFELSSVNGKYALESRFFSAYSLRRAGSYFELLMAAAAGNPARCRILYPASDTIPENENKTAAESHDMEETVEDITYFEAKKLVSERLDFDYPYRRLSKIPSKLSVSKLYPGVLDESDGAEEDAEPPTAVPMPHFLMREPDENITAAERGTAMHTFMQFFDFESVKKLGIAGEIDRLVENRFLFSSDKEKMDIAKLTAFFESRLAREMMSADRIYREKRFMIKYPAALFTEEEADKSALAGEKLLVQGVIDCAYFNEAGELILVDYKTDSFSASTKRAQVEAVLKKRHSRQLGYYKLACERLFGMLPAHTYLYSFALNDVVEI